MNGWSHRREASGGAAWQPPPTAKQDGTRWRDKVRAPVVEQAWETLCGSILQEVRLLKHESYDHPQIDGAQSARRVSMLQVSGHPCPAAGACFRLRSGSPFKALHGIPADVGIQHAAIDVSVLRSPSAILSTERSKALHRYAPRCLLSHCGGLLAGQRRRVASACVCAVRVRRLVREHVARQGVPGGDSAGAELRLWGAGRSLPPGGPPSHPQVRPPRPAPSRQMAVRPRDPAHAGVRPAGNVYISSATEGSLATKHADSTWMQSGCCFITPPCAQVI